MPVIFCKVHNNWNQYRECLALVMLQDGQEKVIFEEAHRSIRNLEMRTSDRFDQSFEKLLDERFKLRNVANV